MANRKISDLTALTAPATGDLLPIVDISEAAAADKNKKITYGALFASIPLGTAAAPSVAFEGDSNTGIYSPGADTIAFVEGGTEAARIDSSGRLLIGTSTARSNFYNSTVTSQTQVEILGTTSFAGASYVCNGANANPADIVLGKTRSTSIGGTTIVQSGDSLGAVSFQGADGSEFVASAEIKGLVDGTPSTNDMPGRLVFLTTADGSAAPVEALRITNDKVIAYNQPTPATYAAAATLTIANLKTGIITYTGAAATLTLPTGTLMEGGFSGIYTNMAFEWSVINTGAGICTVAAGTAHTIVGSDTIAIGASARFASRRTAANTFVSYRLN
jgi:hypothetical protein